MTLSSELGREIRTQAEVLRDQIREALEALDGEGTVMEVPSGPWEGGRVIKLADALDASRVPIPPASAYSTEVRTPARVVVTAVCPRCRESGLISLELTVILQVDSKGAELRLKGSSKAASHVCGQRTAEDVAAEAGLFDIADLTARESGEWVKILADLGFDVPEEVVAGWTLEQQAVVATYTVLAGENFSTEGADPHEAPPIPDLIAEYQRVPEDGEDLTDAE